MPVKKAAVMAAIGLCILGGAAPNASPLFADSTNAVRTLNRRSTAQSLVLPGWGQWSKGYKARGAAIGVVEAGLIGTYFYVDQKRSDALEDFRRGRGPYGRYTRKVDLSNFILIMAGAVWGYNVVDAYIGEPAPNVLFTLEDENTVRVAYRVRY